MKLRQSLDPTDLNLLTSMSKHTVSRIMMIVIRCLRSHLAMAVLDFFKLSVPIILLMTSFTLKYLSLTL